MIPPNVPGQTAANVSERVLIVAPVGQDAAAMAALLQADGLETAICAGPAEGAREIEAGAGALILTEEALELPQVSELLHALQTQPAWSELPVVILTSGGESRLGRLLNLMSTAARGATLMERPIGQSTLLQALQVAIISRRRQYQVRQLLEAQAQLAAIVTSSEDAIVSKTFEGIVTSWNAGAEHIFGYTAQEMIGQSILRLIPPELHDEERRILARLRNGERIEHYETIRVTKSGVQIPMSLTISPIRDSHGRLLGASKIARDVTERRAVEENLRLAKEQAEAASRAKDRFLAALSHELRTPLTPVLMTAAALREDDRLPGEVRAQMAMIERNVLLEARLIDDLLDLSRITHGKLALRNEACDVHSIIGYVIEMVRHEAREKAIGLTVDLGAREHGMMGDSARLQQVFWNLLRNAVKFTPNGGQIRISSRDEISNSAHGPGEKRICVAVTDNGVGLDAAALERIFEPFEQVTGGPPKEKGGGLGLGLAIARALAEMHGGTIYAASAGAGQGSTFTVELPVTSLATGKTAPHFATGSGAEEGAPPARQSLRVLLVEDDQPTLKVLTRLLTRDGHEVVTAGSIEEARAAAARQQFDVVISDLGLPDGTGLDLMEDVRDRHGLVGIMLSGYGMEEDFRRSHEAGFAAHLVKPVDINELRRALLHIRPR